MNVDMEIDVLRSLSSKSSTNSSKKSLVHSGISSILYIKRIKALKNSPT